MAEEEKKPEGEAEQAPKKKLPLGLILIVFQLVVILGAGGLMIKAITSTKPPITKQKMTERAIASVEDSIDDIKIMELPGMTVNAHGKRMVKTTMNIEVSNEATMKILQKRLPVVQAKIQSVIMLYSAKANYDLLSGKLLLKDRIIDVINKELSEQKEFSGVVRDIYFMEFIMI